MIQISVAPMKPSAYVDSTSRYNSSNVLYYGERNIITFETYKRKPFKPSTGDKYYVITKGTEFRPDLVSNKAYGTPGFWWKILEANKMMDIREFTVGTNIVIPSVLL